jgi:hypothetical protein
MNNLQNIKERYGNASPEYVQALEAEVERLRALVPDPDDLRRVLGYAARIKFLHPAIARLRAIAEAARDDAS